MKKRDIIIVMAVIAFGLIYNALKTGDFDIRFDKGVPVTTWQLKDKSHPNDFPREEIQYNQVDKIEISNIAGDIKVEKAALNTDETSAPGIRIYPTIRVYHRDKRKAEEISKEIKINTVLTTETIEGDNVPGKKEKKKVRIEVKSMEDFSLRRTRVRFKLVIPETVELDLKNRYGDMEINGCGTNITLDGKHGDITVKHVDSPVEINHKNGRVVVTDVQNSVILTSRNSRIRINNIAELKLDCYLANADISQVENKVLIENAAYTTITMDQGNGFSASGRHTKYKLTNIKNNVQIKNSHQSISMRKIKGNIHINANNCRINLDEVTSGDVVIKNAHKYVNIDKISAENLDILMSEGDLDIAFDQIKEKLNIKNRNSKVTLIYPSSVRPVYNIEARYGSITDRTEEKLAILKERGRELVTSSHLEGKPKITINTTYGDVLLETRTQKDI
jgi:DUF4097 and DUF4098 domain-containing protein YvlB